MTNVPVERGNTARQQPQVATTDADREAAERILDAQTNGYCVTLMRGDAIEAIARARAEGAASEREACVRDCVGEALDGGVSDEDAAYNTAISDCVRAIRARGEGGKA